jgi:hypothetical protein
MLKDQKIIGGILLLFTGFFILAKWNNDTSILLAGLGISAIGAYLILSNLK